MKGKVYRRCVRAEMLCGSETWREIEMAILRRTEDLMGMLGLKESVEWLVRVNGSVVV